LSQKPKFITSPVNSKQGLAEVATNMAMLNDNIESLLLLGGDLHQVSNVWGEFHKQLVEAGEGNALGS
jgi:hypothetical protein